MQVQVLVDLFFILFILSYLEANCRITKLAKKGAKNVELYKVQCFLDNFRPNDNMDKKMYINKATLPTLKHSIEGQVHTNRN